MVQPLESCLSTLMSAGNRVKIHGILKWIVCGLSWKNIFSAVDSVLSSCWVSWRFFLMDFRLMTVWIIICNYFTSVMEEVPCLMKHQVFVLKKWVSKMTNILQIQGRGRYSEIQLGLVSYLCNLLSLKLFSETLRWKVPSFYKNCLGCTSKSNVALLMK